MEETHGWRLESKCAKELTIKEADALFFPTAGGKPHKAAMFCSDCPFKTQCLFDAIEKRLQGFFAGTTEDQRRRMESLHSISPIVDDLPPEPGRRILRKLVTIEDNHTWLDDPDLEPSPEELLALQIAS